MRARKMSEWDDWGVGSTQCPDNDYDICGSTSPLLP